MRQRFITTIFFLILTTNIFAQPRWGDTFWCDSVPESMRKDYISFGEQYKGKEWHSLPAATFAEFKKTGNRTNYEGLLFEKRRQLAALVLAEAIEGQRRFLPDIINGLQSTLEETWWGLPAHYKTEVPRTEDQTVDLFNAETASLIAWTRYVMGKELDSFSPLITRRIDDEIARRILQPAVKTNYWWKKAGMNWNPWICSNWLACVMFCEHDENRKSEAIGQIRKACQAFTDLYPDDGGCDEGPGYWDRAAASMFEVLRLLPEDSSLARLTRRASSASNTSISRKIRAMASYSYKTYIEHDYCVNFADAHENKAAQQVNIVYPCGHWLNDKTMREFGAYLGRTKQVLTQPALLYDKSGNFPTLGRELFFLRNIRDFIAE